MLPYVSLLVFLVLFIFIVIQLLKTKKWLIYGLGLIILLILSRQYLFEIITIDGNSMENSYFEEEKVFVFILPYYIPSLSDYSRNDVVIFRSPNNSEMVIKRIVGLPGDSLEIVDTKLFINREYFPANHHAKFWYKFWFSDQIKFIAELKGLGINPDKLLLQNDSNYVELNVSVLQATKLSNTGVLNRVARKPIIMPEHILDCYPYHKDIYWSMDNFGPVLIPKSGQSVKASRQNLILYKPYINFKEDEGSDRFTFTKDTYFVVGDNRYHSTDSRNWGFLPKNDILGKVLFKSF